MKKFYITVFSVFGLLVLIAMLGESMQAKKQLETQPTELQEIQQQLEIPQPIEIQPEIAQTNQATITEIKTETTPQEEVTELKFIKPVEGEIEMNYSPETLIYSKTLGEWKTHNGIDIKAERGTPIKAVETGTITNITETTDKGIEITITHQNGYKTVYSNLSTKTMVAPNQKVEKGQVISGIGNTAAFEYYEPDHLHFEVYKDGNLIDPNNIFK